MMKAHPGVLAITEPSLGETPLGGLLFNGGPPSGRSVIGKIGRPVSSHSDPSGRKCLGTLNFSFQRG